MNRVHAILWRTLVAAATGAWVGASLAADPDHADDSWPADMAGPDAWQITQPVPLTGHRDIAPWPRSMPMHPGVHDTLFAPTASPADAVMMCAVPSSASRRGESRPVLQAHNGPGSIASPSASGTRSIAAKGGTGFATKPPSSMQASPQHAAAASAATSTNAITTHGMPFFPSASDGFREGFVRVINHSGVGGEVRIRAVDDAGHVHGPITLAIDARATAHFNSGDLERGNAAKGLASGAGPGVGDWRLTLESDLDIEVLGYVRTADGFLTAMHDVVGSVDGVHRLPTFNPASNADQVSRLRIVNPANEQAEVTIRGIDDLGHSSHGVVQINIPPSAAWTLDATQLEFGGNQRQGLGDGTGKWRLDVESGQPIEVMSLLESPTGHLSNLSTTPANLHDGVHTVPFFPAAGGERQGFVRIINHSGERGEIRIRAFDDSDWEYAEVQLPLAANAVAHFNSEDLELGNPQKGLSGGVGSGQGDWRLALASDLGIDVLAYVRTTQGFLTAMHDVAPSIGIRHRVAVFNPASNQDQVSQLRLVNVADQPTEVVVTGIDGIGATSNSEVRLTVPGGQSRTITAQQLESGADWLEGALGDGQGKWQLNVRSEQPIMVMSLLASPTGHLTNLSTAPARGANATSTEVFEALVAAPVLESKCVNCHVEGGASGTTRLVFVSTANSDHRALNLEAVKNFVATVEDGAALLLDKIQGIGHGGGEQVARGSEDFANVAWFLDLVRREAAVVSASADMLFDGVAMASPRTVLRRAALLFAGRIPTAAEYEFIEVGTDDALRETIRNLMTGPRFHEFLLRAANDRLLTDRYVDENTLENRGHFYHFDNKYYRLRGAAVKNGAGREFNEWHNAVQYGVARAPLELIAHVAENDLPYTEVLTADYVMANRLTKESYTGTGAPDHPEDVHDFRPTQITDYLTHKAGYRARFEPNIGLRILSPGEGKTAIPHAGVLNTLVFLKRYPTTATNRNRARARWTYYHFLGVDIENAASRTTDPVALADTNNPTMKNANCTVCHTVLDPAAGAFQNYGDIGLYRDEPGGLDALDRFYKNPVGEEFEIEAASYEERETVSARLRLDRDSRVYVAFTNDYWQNGTDIDRNLRLDSLELLDGDRNVVFEADLATLENQDCGEAVAAEDGGEADHWVILNGCGVRVDVEIPTTDTYEAAVTAWADQAGDELAKLEIAATPYQSGDTWYRDMREPGFDGESLRDSGNGLQWLAKQIAEDPRFAEATVKFWWPALMGKEVIEPPQDEQDADFGARLLAASAQAADVRDLAEGFRVGFGDGKPYSLKDLLVEIALSDWARAEAVDGESSAIQRAALAHAGTGRLLTPVELAHKTDTITGFQWGRWEHPSARPFRQHTNALADVRGYRLLYGGIDSNGITDRSRDLTSVMASVARTHAAESSCPIVFREFYLLPDQERRLFGGIHKNVSPVAEASGSFSIEAESFEERETITVSGHLQSGTNTVWLSFPNDYYNEETGADRNVRLDALEVVDASGTTVARVEFENLEEGCGSSESSDGSAEADHRALWQPCELRVPLTIPSGGAHEVKVIAWADLAGGQLPFLDVAVESNTETSAGSWAIRNKLAELYGKLLGVEVSAQSPDVEDAYQLFVDVWKRRRETGNNWFFDTACNWGSDIRYFDGIADDVLIRHDRDWGSYYTWDWPRVNRILYDEAAPYDSAAVVRSWNVVLTYLLMDYRYLYL
ncbi:MAG: DUF1588 domain-containing protein [Gammaproteobacteria bacterium]|nr:DUF1588 domain-containing protein [Gammaproteobacteria bacterium]MYK48606.1 DUF1588 domain-containing protein [Gammaproteobacteria bacterium]